MPAWTPPQFINALDIWKFPRNPAVGAPNATNRPYQIYTWSRAQNSWQDPATGKWVPIILIREPSAPSIVVAPGDVLGKDLAAPNDDQLYLLLYKIRMHSGFPNAYIQYPSVRCRRDGTVWVPPLP